MFGYASDETKELMPLPIQLSHQLLKTIRNKRLKIKIMGLGPDAKSQFSIIYENGRPIGINSVVLSIQHLRLIQKQDVKDICSTHNS